MIELTWEQASAWRAEKHHLYERAKKPQMLDVVRQISGVQAQVMSAAELALWARVEDVKSDDVQDALWQQKSLVKVWMMRGTLHLVAADDLPLFVAAASSTRDSYTKGAWLKYYGVTLDEINAIIKNVPKALEGRTLTREELADEVARLTHAPHLRERLLSGWGAMLKPAAAKGYLCFGPNQGRNITFTHPKTWLDSEWTDIDSKKAQKTILRRYLTTYAPVTREDFARWWGILPAAGKKWFPAIAEELEEVDVEGTKSLMLKSDAAAMMKFSKPDTVRLLPNFDPYALSSHYHSRYLRSKALEAKMYRTSGWVSPAVLVNGQIRGTWEYEEKRANTNVTVSLFAPLASDLEQQIEAEAQKLGTFFETEITVKIDV
jgi:hypothetical protein